MDRQIAVIGLGHVGLPTAVALARAFPGTLGFDIDAVKVERLCRGEEPTGVLAEPESELAALRLSSRPEELAGAQIFVVAVPTPIDAARSPDLAPLRRACELVGAAARPGALVVFESTGYPGMTEGPCAAWLARASGLAIGSELALAYAPERINPGDPEHGLAQVVKVVSAQDAETLELVSELYAAICPAGLYRAPSIAVAEAAKVIENVQRDLNIALMNELAQIFERLGLDTQAVLDAAATKWNFQRYHPGLVGGHCIGVDPYYLTARAEEVGIQPQVILAGRRVNDEMAAWVASRVVKLLARAEREVRGARVAVLGLAFKPDVRDTRQSRVPELCRELGEYGAEVLVHDPLADAGEVEREHGLVLVDEAELVELDALVLATPHAGLAERALELLPDAPPARPMVVVDVLGALRGREPAGASYWRL